VVPQEADVVEEVISEEEGEAAADKEAAAAVEGEAEVDKEAVATGSNLNSSSSSIKIKVKTSAIAAAREMTSNGSAAVDVFRELAGIRRPDEEVEVEEEVDVAVVEDVEDSVAATDDP